MHVPAARFAKDIKQEDVTEDSNSEQSGSEDETGENDQSLTSLKLEKLELEEEGRDYTLGEMTDLQSRLMLVTGKADAGRESIERFTSVSKVVFKRGDLIYIFFFFHINSNDMILIFN